MRAAHRFCTYVVVPLPRPVAFGGLLLIAAVVLTLTLAAVAPPSGEATGGGRWDPSGGRWETAGGRWDRLGG